MPTPKDIAAAFFYKHAGYGYDPKKETKDQGRKRGARLLAEAEANARSLGYTFEWVEDEYTDSSDFDDGDPYPVWNCVMLNQGGKRVQSLSGIDFGRDKEPHGPYMRVVEAELALEQLG